MPQLRLYMDKHIPKAITSELRKHGIDVIRCEEVGMGAATDLEHLEYASSENRIVVTHDKDFTKLHAQWQSKAKPHSGIICVSRHLQGQHGIGPIVKSIIMYDDMVEGEAASIKEDFENQVIYLS